MSNQQVEARLREAVEALMRIGARDVHIEGDYVVIELDPKALRNFISGFESDVEVNCERKDLIIKIRLKQ